MAVVSDFSKAFIRDCETEIGDNFVISTKTGLYPYRAIWEGYYCKPKEVYKQRDYVDFNFTDDYKYIK